MCTDEMTAGSVMVPQRERRRLAAASHAFNVAQKRFVAVFPDYATDTVRDLPNMVQRTQSSDAPRAQNSDVPRTQGSDVPEAPPPDAPRAPEPSWSARHAGMSVLVVLACLFAAKVLETASRRS